MFHSEKSVCLIFPGKVVLLFEILLQLVFFNHQDHHCFLEHILFTGKQFAADLILREQSSLILESRRIRFRFLGCFKLTAKTKITFICLSLYGILCFLLFYRKFIKFIVTDIESFSNICHFFLKTTSIVTFFSDTCIVIRFENLFSFSVQQNKIELNLLRLNFSSFLFCKNDLISHLKRR